MIQNYFGNELNKIFNKLNEDFFNEANGVEEIRIRIEKPILIYKRGEEFSVTKSGKITENILFGYCPQRDDINKTLELMSNYSPYAFNEEIKNGFITLNGGYRVGIVGEVILDGKSMDSSILTIKNISGLNIRFSREIKNCSEKIMKYIADSEIKHTIIISPPKCGKTTLLRDVIRKISDGEGTKKGQTVGVADERSEIGGSFLGIAQNDVGIRTDILDNCPKELGMRILLRSMSPDVIAVDEIGTEADIHAIDEVINSGVKIICTVHGKNIEDLKLKPVLNNLINKKIFERYIVLGYDETAGEVTGIYDADLNSVL